MDIRHEPLAWFTLYMHGNPIHVRILAQKLRLQFELISKSDRRRSFQVFSIKISFERLKKELECIPYSIAVAYEPKDPDT